MKLFSIAVFMVSIFGMLVVDNEIPYGTANKKQPAGTDFSKLLPTNVGSYKRVSYTPPATGIDGEATYRSGTKEIFMLFSKADTKKELKETMQTIKEEIENNRTTSKRIISFETDPAYIHFIGTRIAFFAWTRELYCFSADSKNADAKALEEFMNAFPY